MAGRVHQVQLIGEAIVRGIIQPHRLRLDRDAALFLNVHIIKDLARHLPRGEPAGLLDQPVGQRGLPMVNVRDNGKITDESKFSHTAPLAGPPRPFKHGGKAVGGYVKWHDL